MKATGRLAGAVMALTLAVPAVAGAANKEHQQLMAEIRMLQEQQQQLQQMLGGLADTLKAMNTRLDSDADVERKAFETVVQKYPSSYDAVLAQQALERLNRRN